MAQPKYVDWDGLVYYDGKIKEYVATRDAQGIKMGGVIPFAELPDPSFTNLNYIYKITDGFTSNRDFEKPNLIYKENTWVQCANINNTDTYLYIIFNDNELEGQGGKFDPENYYTKEDIDSTFVTKSDMDSELDDISEDIETANQSILDLASAITTNADDIETLKQDLAETEAKVDDVEAAVKLIKVPTKTSDLTNDSEFITAKDIPETDLSGYYTSEEVDTLTADLVSKKELADDVSALEAKINEIEVPTKVSDLENDTGYITSEDIPDVTGLVTKEEFEVVQQQSAGNNNSIIQLDAEIFDIKQQLENIPEAELYKVDFNKPDFAEAKAAYEAGKVLILINAAPDVNSYALMNYVSDTYITFTKFLTSRKQTYGYFNTYYLRPDDSWELSKEVRLNKVEANAEGKIEGSLRTIQIGNEIYTLPDLTGYATEEFVIAKISEAELSGDGSDIDLSVYALKSDIPDVSNFVTSEVVNELVSAKADDVLFTEDKVVGNAIGLFAVGDPVKGLTIRQLFEKLLGLTVPVTPDEPSDPDEDLTLVEKIIKNELSMYSITDDGQLVTNTFKTISMDAEPTESGFVVEYDADGKAITGGYQELSINNDEMYYVIALPKEIDYNTQVTIQAYDPDEKLWNDSELYLTSDPDIVTACCDEVGIDVSHIDTSKYTIWTSEDICTGSILRFIIKE